jgi:hypothetical protein
MTHFGIRYSVLVGCVMTMFMNFIACGAQLYQVSLTEDHEPQQIPTTATDPSSPTYGLHAPKGWKALPVHFKVGMSLTPDQQQGLVRAMNTWEIAAGKKLFVYQGIHDGVTGDSFSDLYSSLDDGVNGHYLDEHWGKTGKPSVVLATTIWDNDPSDSMAIQAADIRFNSNYYNLGDSFKARATDEREVVDMQTLALHELGHLLGLAHISAQVDSFSIMTASLYIGEGLANRRLSKGDIERLHRIYGCEGASCDVDATLARIEAQDRQSRGRQAQTPSTASTAH